MVTLMSLKNMPAEERDRALYEEFQLLAAQWAEETSGYAVSLRRFTHPAYLRIIGMGECAVPWILEELEEHGGQWFTALTAITGENPIPHEDRGRGASMRAAWRKWGQEHGWID